MKRIIGNLIVVALAIAAISFFAAPAVAFFAIRAAADARDTAGLSRLVDYGAVRQSLRPQISGRADALAPPPSFLEDPVGAVRRQFEQNPVTGAPDVEGYLTPQGLAALTRGEGRAASLRSAPGAAPVEGADDPWPAPRFWGVNRARLSVAANGADTVFTFERRGPFEWRLVHVGLPPVTPATPAV